MPVTLTAAQRYGSTIALAGMTPTMSLVSGVDAVADDLLCRLQQTVWYDPDYGLPLEPLVLNSTSQGTALLASQIEHEMLKDDRVDTAEVEVAFDDADGLTINIFITLSGDEEFQLIGHTIGDITTQELVFAASF